MQHKDFLFLFKRDFFFYLKKVNFDPFFLATFHLGSRSLISDVRKSFFLTRDFFSHLKQLYNLNESNFNDK